MSEKCAPDCDEREACEVTGMGHLQCGVCPDHNEPRHHCGCIDLSALAEKESTE